MERRCYTASNCECSVGNASTCSECFHTAAKHNGSGATISTTSPQQSPAVQRISATETHCPSHGNLGKCRGSKCKCQLMMGGSVKCEASGCNYTRAEHEAQVSPSPTCAAVIGKLEVVAAEIRAYSSHFITPT